MKKHPSGKASNSACDNNLWVCGVIGQQTVNTSERDRNSGIQSSCPNSSTVSGFSIGSGSTAITSNSNALARWATALPIPPSPRIPIVIPDTSTHGAHFHSLSRINSSCALIARVNASKSAKACSASCGPYRRLLFISVMGLSLKAGYIDLSTPTNGCITHCRDFACGSASSDTTP